MGFRISKPTGLDSEYPVREEIMRARWRHLFFGLLILIVLTSHDCRQRAKEALLSTTSQWGRTHLNPAAGQANGWRKTKHDG